MKNVWRFIMGMGILFWGSAIPLALKSTHFSVGSIVAGTILISFALIALSLLRTDTTTWWLPKVFVALGIFPCLFIVYFLAEGGLSDGGRETIDSLNAVSVGLGAILTAILLICSPLISLSILAYRDKHESSEKGKEESPRASKTKPKTKAVNKSPQATNA